MKSVVLVDTNILVRFLMRDHETLSPQAQKIFLRAQAGNLEIYIDEVVVAETVWLLTSFYDLSKKEIFEKLYDLFIRQWFNNPRKNYILSALEMYSQTNLSYIDCWIAIVSKNLQFPLETFDLKLKKQSS